MGGALVATLGTLAIKTLTDKVINPRLEELANSMLDKAGQPVSKPVTKPGAPKTRGGPYRCSSRRAEGRSGQTGSGQIRVGCACRTQSRSR